MAAFPLAALTPAASWGKKVYGIDVGYGQVDACVMTHGCFERTHHLRYLQPSELYKDGELADLGVVDVSFISQPKFCLLCGNCSKPREAVLLVKPQFEVGRSRVGKKGVVRDTYDQASAIFQV